MKNQRWLAGLTAVIAIILLGVGGCTAWIAVHDLEVFSRAWDSWDLSALYVVVTEGLLFGVMAAICAVGLFMGRPWARRMLLVVSVLLALTAIVAIGMAPQQWDTQGIFILYCVLLWWGSRKSRTD